MSAAPRTASHFVSPATEHALEMLRGARPFIMVGSSMAPTVEPGQVCLVHPDLGYMGPGLHVVMILNEPCVCRVEGNFNGGFRVSRDHPLCADFTMTREQFDDDVVGRVVALVAIQ
jgi:hypothetical protein